ncbi:MAG: hypothetical protein ACERKK_08570 [Poseidonibacter sp.]|uniref:hypothetical protein n=1 Tax=Poseidonibacter sp. TaxID=2321188 RepID=UPI00359D6B29
MSKKEVNKKMVTFEVRNEVIEMSIEEIINEYKKSKYNRDDVINDEKVKLFIVSNDGLNATISSDDLTQVLQYCRLVLDNGYTYLWKKGFPLN